MSILSKVSIIQFFINRILKNDILYIIHILAKIEYFSEYSRKVVYIIPIYHLCKIDLVR
jgi:hypothetical protein